MKKLFKTLTILILAVFISIKISATGFQFKKYQVDNGLSQNTVRVILQDKNGFIWFGTQDGLNRFDGREYRIFRNDPANKNTIGNNFIYTLYEDDHGKIWVGTDSRLYIFDPITQHFSLFTKKTAQGIEINSPVLTICAEDENTLWIGSKTQGLFCYKRSEDKLIQFKPEENNSSIKSNLVWDILKDYSGELWVGTRNGLNRYNKETRTFFTYSSSSEPNRLHDSEVTTIYEDSDGELWLGTWEGGLSKFNKTTETFTTWFDKKDIKPYITHIHAIFEYKKDNLLIGADDGLYLFDKKNETFQRIDDPHDPNSLSDQNVYSIYKDRENGIWIGTYFGGANYIIPNSDAIEHYYPKKSEHSLSGKAVSQFCEDDKGNLWIATEDAGLNYFDTTTKQFNLFPSQKEESGVSYHNLHSLVLDKNHLWIGTFSRGVDVLDLRTNSFKNYRYRENDTTSIDDNCVFSIYQDNKKEIYIGTSFGLSRYNPKKDNFTRIPEVRNFVYDMQEDPFGSFWIATYGSGVFRHNPQKKEWKNYKHDTTKRNSLSNDKVIDIFVDSKQRLWFATEGRGICKYNYETDDFSTIDNSQGLPNDVVYGILDDKYGNLWVSTNKGITKINPETLVSRTYTREDGLQSNQFNYKSSYKSRDGIFYFGGVNGFNVLNPDKLTENNYIPPVAITNFELLSKELTSLSDPAFHTAMRKSKKITLRHNQSSFRISFVSLSFQAPEKNQYATYMENLDDEWTSIGNQKSISYINLPAGEYTFRVKGSNNNNLWNEAGDYLQIKIFPPLWKSTLACILYILIILSALFFAIRYYSQVSRKKQNQKLKDYQQEKEKEVYDSKINFFTNVAHEIRTPISLIKAPLECVLSSDTITSETREYLSVIERNTNRLLVLVNQLLDFRKTEEHLYQLNFSRTSINELLGDIYYQFKATADSNKKEIILEVPDQPVFANINREAFTKILSNLLSNGLRHSVNWLRVVLTEDKITEMMEIKVIDDGPGIEEKYRKKIFEPFFQIENNNQAEKKNGTGIGLALSKQLVERHKGSIALEKAESGGCVFKVRIPTSLTPAVESDLTEEISATDSFSTSQVDQHHPDKFFLLIVEDNEELKKFLEKNLKKDYNVLTAEDGIKAIQILDEYSVDLIISDIVMPEMDGLELTQQIKQNRQYSHIPIILLSAKTNLQTKIDGLECGADVYIEKPFSIGYLKAQVSNLIDNRIKLLEKFSKSPFVSYGSIANNKKDEDFLNQLNEEIEKNLSDIDFSIEKLAFSLSMSRSNLQRKIKGISGMVPNDYIRVYRLKKAALLLMQGDYRINEICFLTGFNTPSYFSKCFKKQFGVLPKDFLKEEEKNY
jgi:ligand-binding sensor domain-containing protein/signal transduction histidine kinase/DNA-binding response OmpR family regulator